MGRLTDGEEVVSNGFLSRSERAVPGSLSRSCVSDGGTTTSKRKHADRLLFLVRRVWDDDFLPLPFLRRAPPAVLLHPLLVLCRVRRRPISAALGEGRTRRLRTETRPAGEVVRGRDHDARHCDALPEDAPKRVRLAAVARRGGGSGGGGGGVGPVSARTVAAGAVRAVSCAFSAEEVDRGRELLELLQCLLGISRDWALGAALCPGRLDGKPFVLGRRIMMSIARWLLW